MLITDLDNTIYDWVTFFSTSFEAMVKSLSDLLQVDEETLLGEFKQVHQYHGNSEHPFAILELPSVKRAFPNRSRQELLGCLKLPLDAFNNTRDRYLTLYENVTTTLEKIKQHGVKIIAYTDAFSVNAYYRIRKLGIEKYLTRLYASDGFDYGHPNPEKATYYQPPLGFLNLVPKNKRKPDPVILLEICERENTRPEDTIYIGDSLTKDISMANRAGITSVWAKYGTEFDASNWGILVKVTHWTPEDVEREEQLRLKYKSANPDYTINRFADVLNMIDG